MSARRQVVTCVLSGTRRKGLKPETEIVVDSYTIVRTGRLASSIANEASRDASQKLPGLKTSNVPAGQSATADARTRF